ncbi:hypothetical protein HID58_029890 [Brassica napus]|uniref:Uncharacterized protein n=1 Tax=Brassica napus TaxID=3708 RepID=A0ABQ8CEC9_BRANA|nr:hypothetical protein HID58_029890 [Brassica napus]
MRRFSFGKQMKVKSQEQKLAVPEPALIKDLDSRCEERISFLSNGSIDQGETVKEPAILMTIVITEKDTKKFELGFSRWW